MKLFVPTQNRLKLAGITFVLALATTTLLWSQGRQFGHEEALRPTVAPTAEPNLFNNPEVFDYTKKLTVLRVKLPEAKTREQKQALAGEFVTLAEGAHFKNQGGGKLSLDAYDDAMKLFRAIGQSRGEADALMNRATTVGMLGQPKEAEENLRQALDIFMALPDTDLQQAEVLIRLGGRLGGGGHYEEARNLLDRSLRIRQIKAEHNGEADCVAALGQLSYEQGQLALARMLLGQAAQSFAALGKTPSRAAVLGQLGDVALAEGEIDEAEKLYSEGLSVWKEAKQDFWVGRFLARRARVALAKQELDQAKQLAEESKRLLEASNGPTSAAWPLMVLGEVAARSGNKALAQQYFAKASALHQQAGRVFGAKLVEEAQRTL